MTKHFWDHVSPITDKKQKHTAQKYPTAMQYTVKHHTVKLQITIQLNCHSSYKTLVSMVTKS